MKVIAEKMDRGIKLGRIADDVGICRTTLWRRLKEWKCRSVTSGASEDETG
jgi:transcriptional regulator of acetoin/glycerol metabolism